MKQQLIRLVQWIRRIIVGQLHYDSEDLPYYISIIILLIPFVAGLNAFLEITEELAGQELVDFDTRVTEYVLSFRSNYVTDIFRFITNLGGRIAYISITCVLTLVFLLKHKTRRFIIQTVAVSVLAALSNVVLKEAVNRARPSLEHLVLVTTLSYPSGHAMTAMAFYGFLIYLLTQFKMKTLIKAFLITVLSVLIFLIGISRIYLGVHYPSDVLAGFAGGLIWVAFCAIVFNLIDLLRIRKARMTNLLKVSDNPERE